MDADADGRLGADRVRAGAPTEARSLGKKGPRGPQPCSVCGEPGHKAPTCPRRPTDDRTNPLAGAPTPEKKAADAAPPADAETLRRALEPVFVLVEEALEPALVAAGGKLFPRARLDGQEVRVVARLNATLWADALVAWQVPADKYVLLLAAAGTTATTYGVPAYALARERRAVAGQGRPGTTPGPREGDDARQFHQPEAT